jgi:signal transduction histidine kinase
MTDKKLNELFRLDKSVKTEGTAGERGTGLGLILCKELSNKLNGRIITESVPGRGTKITVELPSQKTD